MKPQIVIARYNENIEWVKYINPEIFDIIIYNKGNTIESKPSYRIINIENIGRESHTYLYHIISNYDNLPEKMIFIQAHPFDHVRNTFFQELVDFINNESDFYYFSKNILKIQYDENKNKYREEGMLNGNYWTNYHEVNSPTFTLITKLFGEYNPYDLKIAFGTGAIFGVSKTNVEKYDVEFYQKCIDILVSNTNKINPDDGHAYERLWNYIFM